MSDKASKRDLASHHPERLPTERSKQKADSLPTEPGQDKTTGSEGGGPKIGTGPSEEADKRHRK